MKAIYIILTSLWMVSCGGQDQTTQTAPSTDISGVVSLGLVANGKVELYSTDAAGQESGPPLATTTTDKDGNYSFNILQSRIASSYGATPVIVRCVSGTYAEESNGKQITITADTPIKSLISLPADSTARANGSKVVAHITAVSDIAVTTFQKNGAVEAANTLLANPASLKNIGSSDQVELRQWRDAVTTNAGNLTSLPPLPAAFKKLAADPAISNPTQYAKLLQHWMNAAHATEQAFGVKLSAAPADPKKGATTADSAAATLMNAAISQHASEIGGGDVNSLALTKAYGHVLATTGSLNASIPTNKITVAVGGKSVTLAPPDPARLTAINAGIAAGTIKIANGTIVAPTSGKSGGSPSVTLTPPSINSKPPTKAPSGYIPPTQGTAKPAPKTPTATTTKPTAAPVAPSGRH